MKYLIGEIGVSLLIAGLIGLFIGWLLSRFLRSGSATKSHDLMLGDIRRRDQEIDRLRYELRGQRGGSSARSSSGSEREDYQVRALKTQGTTAVLLSLIHI